MGAMACHRHPLCFAVEAFSFFFFSFFLLTADFTKLPVSPAAKQGIPQTCLFTGGTMCMIPTPQCTYSVCRSRGSQLCPNLPPKFRRGSSARRRVARTRQFTQGSTRGKLRADDFFWNFPAMRFGDVSPTNRHVHYCYLVDISKTERVSQVVSTEDG